MKVTQITKAITSSELVEILMKVQKGTFANILTETNVRMNKKNNPYFGLITKVSSQNILLGSNYENRVNNNLLKESKENDFIAQSSKVGNHISSCVLFNENTQLYYLQAEYFGEIKPQIEYYYNGNIIEKQLFAEFLPQKSVPNQNGLDNKVNIFSPKIENIKQITLNKIKYIVS
jgi:hypothetical protein